MIAHPLATPIRRLELFRDLTDEQIVAVANCADRLVFRAGDVVATEGLKSAGSILIIEGTVEQHRRRGAPKSLGAGTLISELSMFVETTFEATFVAGSAVKAVLLPREALVSAMTLDPTLAAAFVGVFAHRLREVANALLEIESESHLDTSVLPPIKASA